MKKWVPIALVLVSVLARNSMAQSWSLPIRAGWSDAKMSGDWQLGGNAVGGFIGTFGAELTLNTDISVEFDLAYVQKGAQGTVTNEVANSPSNPPQTGIYTFSGETSLNYLEIWGMLVPHLDLTDTSDLKGYFGLSLSNLLSAEITGSYNGMPVEQDLSDGIRGIDWAALIGAGVTYDVKSVTLTLDFIGEFGLVNINQSVLDELNFKTQAFYALLGVSIPIHHED